MPLLGRDPSKFGHNGDIDLRKIAQHDFPIIRIDVWSYLPVKAEASACHASGASRACSFRLPNLLRRRILGYEWFTRAEPPPNGLRHIEEDLFEGVNG
jgi:hypothetical protein